MNEKLVAKCRQNAATIADKIMDVVNQKTTVAVERTIARLMGIDGVDPHGVPLPNILVEQLQQAKTLGDGSGDTDRQQTNLARRKRKAWVSGSEGKPRLPVPHASALRRHGLRAMRRYYRPGQR